MSYNIRVGYGAEDFGVSPWVLKDRPKNLSRVAAAIRSVDPDVVGLQEVLGEAQVRELATALNLNYAYVAHADTRPGWWGVALLSKYRIVDVRGVHISPPPAARRMLVAKVSLGGRTTAFASVHVDDRTTEQSLREVWRAVDKIAAPLVLMGDFNVTPADRSLAQFRARFVDTAEAVDTENSRNARRLGTFQGLGRIDYILVEPQHFLIQDAGIGSREHWNASDHRPYYTRIAVRASGARN